MRRKNIIDEGVVFYFELRAKIIRLSMTDDAENRYLALGNKTDCYCIVLL